MMPPVPDQSLAALFRFPAPPRDGDADHPHRASRASQSSSETQLGDHSAPIKSLLPRIGISTRKLKKLEAIQLVREQRDTRTQEVSYNARPFVLCGLPLRRPPADQLVYARHNGSFVLEITAHPRFGLPYGQDRLVPIWMATLTLKQRNRTVHFERPTQLLDYFRLPKDGAQYRRVKAAFQRIFAATIFFGTEQETKKQIVVESARFHFMDSMRLWFNRSEEFETTGDATSDNTITLSEAFYQEITARPIPVEREVIAALAHAPGLLDFYVWIAWKSWTVNSQPARIPIFGANGLGHQLGTTEYSVDRTFKHKIGQWLKHVKVLWPECPAQISQDGRFVVVQSSRRSAAVRPVERPVNP